LNETQLHILHCHYAPVLMPGTWQDLRHSLPTTYSIDLVACLHMHNMCYVLKTEQIAELLPRP